ncbi:MAG: hypothetical protein ACRYGG_23270 [Janthinobacterium lividum]
MSEDDFKAWILAEITLYKDNPVKLSLYIQTYATMLLTDSVNQLNNTLSSQLTELKGVTK